MTINHLNLTVIDPIETSGFLIKYFDLRAEGGNAGMQLLRDDAGMVLTLMKSRAEDRDRGDATASGPARVKYPGSFHIGFIQGNRERVDQINQRLRDDGMQIDAPALLHGAWTFYFKAPGGFTVEVMA